MMPTLNFLEWSGVAMLFCAVIMVGLVVMYVAERAWESWTDERWDHEARRHMHTWQDER